MQQLRHRGYDSFGITVGGETYRSTDPLTSGLRGMVGNFSIGHTRYTTRGTHKSLEQAQPLLGVARDCNGTPSIHVSLVHNGQVEPTRVGAITGLTLGDNESDSFYILNLLVGVIEQTLGQPRDIFFERLLQELFTNLSGSYSCIALISGFGLIAFRDPCGIRPLVYGTLPCHSVSFASESCGLIGESLVPVNVAPGQLVHVDNFGVLNTYNSQLSRTPRPGVCLFEFIYLAHDDSVIDGMSVSETRKELGRLLVTPIVSSGLQIDIVIPIPHTPNQAAFEIATSIEKEYVELLTVISRTASSTDDRRQSRTFILPTNDARESAVKTKFALDAAKFEKCRGKNILLVDDSIVRGTTLKHVIELVRSVKPNKIFVASLAPPIISPNKYGIDIPSVKSLVTRPFDGKKPVSEVVADKLGLDAPVIYQSLSAIEDKFGRRFEDSVFRTNADDVAEILGEQF